MHVCVHGKYMAAAPGTSWEPNEAAACEATRNHTGMLHMPACVHKHMRPHTLQESHEDRKKNDNEGMIIRGLTFMAYGLHAHVYATCSLAVSRELTNGSLQ